MDTIFALSSGGGRSAIGIVRLSGFGVRDILCDCCGSVPQPRFATLLDLREPTDQSLIDRALVLWFPGPSSFTGEDCAEFHVHGSPAVVKSLLTMLSARAGFRMAEPGEFAKRAFENGKLDLTSVEGLADLIAAETDAQRRQALNQAGGALRKRVELWRDRLLVLSAELEAQLDFSDEDDVPDAISSAVYREMAELADDFNDSIVASARADRVRSGYRVALVGLPNAGKSTLLNVLAQRDVAIVTPEKGTTRDLIEVPLDLGGYPVVVTDSAGIRTAESLAERAGVDRALAAANRSDLVLWLSDGSDTDADQTALDDWRSSNNTESPEFWLIRTKADLMRNEMHDPTGEFVRSFDLSATEGTGLSQLTKALSGHVADSLANWEPSDGVVARERQMRALILARDALQQAIANRHTSEEIVAEHLRACRGALSRITGRMGVEDVLDTLFSEFCIGK